jgi:hypothetical protein
MLKFHESETCEGIIQHLEERERSKRCDVRVRDKGNHTSPDARVEMTFRLGDQLYAIEHTPVLNRLMASWSTRIERPHSSNRFRSR